MRSFAFGSVMDVPVAITPTVTPTIKINHRIMRSPPYQQVGLPTHFLNDQIKCIFHTVSNPLEYLRNRSTFPRREAQNCKGNATLYEYDIHTRLVR